MALTPLLIASLAVTAVSTGTAIAGEVQAAKAAAGAQTAQGQRDARTAEAQARLRERDALVAEREIEDEAAASATDIGTLTRQFRRLRGEQEATIGAAGIEFTGSPLDILAETAAEGQFEIERARFASEQTQQELSDTAAQARFEADELRLGGLDALAVSRARARTTQRAGRIRTVGAGLQGAGRAASLLSPGGTRPRPVRQRTGGGGFGTGIGFT